MKYFIAVLVTAAFASGAHAGESVRYEVGGDQYEGYFAEASDPEGLVLIIHD